MTQRVVKMLKERWSWVSGSFVLCGIMEGRVSEQSGLNRGGGLAAGVLLY